MPTFMVFSKAHENDNAWFLRGTTMADSENEAIDNLAKTDAGKNNVAMGDTRLYAACRSSYWKEHEIKFEVTPHRVNRAEALDRAKESAKV